MSSRCKSVARKIQRAIEGSVVEPVRYMTVLNKVSAYVQRNASTGPGYWAQVEEAVKAELLKGYTLRAGETPRHA